jgi:hypothetical protein
MKLLAELSELEFCAFCLLLLGYFILELLRSKQKKVISGVESGKGEFRKPRGKGSGPGRAG